MVELGGKDNNDFFEKELANQKKSMSIADSLIEGAEELIDTVVDSPDKLKELQAIILLRHPDTMVEPSMGEVKSFLCDLPAFILSVHSQYLRVKFERENKEEQVETKMGILRSEAEKLIIADRLAQKASGFPLSSFGNITKEALMDKIRTMAEYEDILKLDKELQEIKYKEEMLKKVVDVLENRRYELGKIAEIEMRGSV